MALALTNRPLIDAKDMTNFIDPDLGRRLRGWDSIKADAKSGTIYLGTEVNIRSALVTEVAPEYLRKQVGRQYTSLAS